MSYVWRPRAESARFPPVYGAYLQQRYGRLGATALARAMLRVFAGRIALVSSFGAESAVLLDLVARIDRTVPVIFLDTGKHFPETLAYRDRLIAHLGLADVRIVAPDPLDLAAEDGDGALWRLNPDHCCRLRKVLPLSRALADFDAWITGRKRFHGGTRRDLPRIEVADGRVKINPLAHWTRAAVMRAFRVRGLPAHPLRDEGFLSIGCLPCTSRVAAGAPVRAGRWAGTGKTECGIHGRIPAPRAGRAATSGIVCCSMAAAAGTDAVRARN